MKNQICLFSVFTLCCTFITGLINVSADELKPMVNLTFEKQNTELEAAKGLTLTKGIIGNAAHFDGTPEAGLVLPIEGFSSPAAISVWVKVDAPRFDYRLLSRSDDATDKGGIIRFAGYHVQAWNGSDWIELVPFIPVNGTWQHLAIVFNKDGNATGYLNGKEMQSGKCSFEFADTKFCIGTASKLGGGGSFSGSLDELRIYNRALSKSEISKLYPAKLYSRAENDGGTKITGSGKIALKESVEPIRPGIPGVRPFWNDYAVRFIYAPAFDFKPLEGAKHYKYTAINKSDGSTAQFEDAEPTAALSPIWLEINPGRISLKVEGIGPDGKVVGVAGTRDFVKSPPYNGPYKQRAAEYKECAIASLAAQFNSTKFQNVLKNGRPDYNFVFPCKFMNGLTTGMLIYSKYTSSAEERDQAIKMAQLSIDFLLELTEKDGTPLAGWPPTYWNGYLPDDPMFTRQRIMTLYPACAAQTYLDMYDFTKERKYMSAALTVADTYSRLQLENGVWYQLMDPITGESSSPNILIPTRVIAFLDRLKESYGITKYEAMRERAFNWIMENPMKTYNWQGQFEDVDPKPPYVDQSNPDATEISILLFKGSDKNPEYLEMAKELLRFAEDQFVVWDRRDAVARYNWAIPGALEQYVCYTTINGSNCSFINAYIAAYEATKDPIYKEKAISLANTLTVAWKDFGEQEIPTWMQYGEESNNWINCSLISSQTLLELDKLK